MGGLFLFDSIASWRRRRSFRQKLSKAREWPAVAGEINHWRVLPASRDELSGATPCQIEAGFHFMVNGEYYGGYFYSVGLGQHAAETKVKGNPSVKARYDPVNPDTNIVLSQDNPDNLPFAISPHPPAT
jgi:hypothetical protein